MNYGDHMEERATTHDADDPECAKCGHPLSFHVRADMIAVQPCDYIMNLEDRFFDEDPRDTSEDKFCGCTSWQSRD